MQRYGLILADNGSNWYFQGDVSSNWSDQIISELKRIPAGAFDAVDASSLMIDPNSGLARGMGGELTVEAAAINRDMSLGMSLSKVTD